MCSIFFPVAPRLWPFSPKLAKTPILSLFLKGHLRGFQFSRGQSIDKLLGAPTCSSCSKHIYRAPKFLFEYDPNFGSMIKKFGAWCRFFRFFSQFLIMLQKKLSRSHVFECFLSCSQIYFHAPNFWDKNYPIVGSMTKYLGAWQKIWEHNKIFTDCYQISVEKSENLGA